MAKTNNNVLCVFIAFVFYSDVLNFVGIVSIYNLVAELYVPHRQTNGKESLCYEN